MQTVRRPHGFYHANLTLNFFSETAMPQPHRKVIVRLPYGRLAMAVRWHTVFTLSWVPGESYGGLTASLRRPYGKLVIAVRTVRSPYGTLPVSLRSPYGFWFHESYDRRAVAVTFGTTTTVGRKTLRFKKKHVLQTVDRITVRWPYGGSMICDRGITEANGGRPLLVCRCHRARGPVH